MSQLRVEAFFQKSTSTISYLIYDSKTKQAAIIDSALDFDQASGQLSTEFADQQLAFIKGNQLVLKWIFETHAHADHLSAAYYIKQHEFVDKYKPLIAIGENIKSVQQTFSGVFSLSQQELSGEGVEFDRLLKEGQQLKLGDLNIDIMETPGHTPDGISYLIDGHIFVGDTLFMPDAGTARCDFPGGSSQVLFSSIQKIHALPDKTKVWLCHDYQPNERQLMYQTTVGESKQHNIHVNQLIGESEFIEMRTERDQTLAAPKLLYPSLQVNIKAGQLPPADRYGKVFFKSPVHMSRNFS